ncbi:hypothetical protein CTAM01_02261 [Colletotrichum tamarilloi]|uniref:Uncharacterized protein n=1 Tax=Colletotrichum tamarilloi TaxID=1209934 RepID=A0ABQ9RNC3_9PEZI|nr:uncharacterized protein CTAM01_02261 [Colletotrichum tamarilloi]KAK1508475.1 hypothetical protein CTAM01_02261 [Colletotrichum tamarilloi]
MTTIALSLDPVVLSDPNTGTVLDIASTVSFRSSTDRKLFSTINELLAGIQAGDLFILKAQTCCFLVSLTREESNAEDQAVFMDTIAADITSYPIWAQLGIDIVRNVESPSSHRHISFKIEHKEAVLHPTLPPNTTVITMQHLTCSFYIHQESSISEGPMESAYQRTSSMTSSHGSRLDSESGFGLGVSSVE